MIHKPEDLPIGFGDIEYLALIGLFLGFGMQSIALVIAVILSVISAIILKLRKKEIKIPLGFYLSIATAIVIIFAPYLSGAAELINIAIM